MVDVSKLKKTITERGMTIEEVAEKIHVNKSTFYRKLSRNGEVFSVKEANAIMHCLSLSASEATAIFFASVVA